MAEMIISCIEVILSVKLATNIICNNDHYYFTDRATLVGKMVIIVIDSTIVFLSAKLQQYS